MLIASVTASGLLVFCIARELIITQSLDFSVVLRVAEQSFFGCAVAGVLAGIVFGVPLGIVHVLSVRASLLDLEQELETVTDVRDGLFEQRSAEHDAISNHLQRPSLNSNIPPRRG